jgi:hypothetical protein
MVATDVHNERINMTLGVSPNEALLGYHPMLHLDQMSVSNNDETDWLHALYHVQ